MGFQYWFTVGAVFLVGPIICLLSSRCLYQNL
nr:MAG TPA: Protein of unknown function (DUF2542) [Caudoviricetes sp.]